MVGRKFISLPSTGIKASSILLRWRKLVRPMIKTTVEDAKRIGNLLLMMLLRTFSAQLQLCLFLEQDALAVPGQGSGTAEQFTDKIV